jgi:hypothetical protein
MSNIFLATASSGLSGISARVLASGMFGETTQTPDWSSPSAFLIVSALCSLAPLVGAAMGSHIAVAGFNS